MGAVAERAVERQSQSARGSSPRRTAPQGSAPSAPNRRQSRRLRRTAIGSQSAAAAPSGDRSGTDQRESPSGSGCHAWRILSSPSAMSRAARIVGARTQTRRHPRWRPGGRRAGIGEDQARRSSLRRLLGNSLASGGLRRHAAELLRPPFHLQIDAVIGKVRETEPLIELHRRVEFFHHDADALAATAARLL